MDHDTAPWPILIGLAAFTAGAVWVALHTSYDAAALFCWFTAAGTAYIAAHLIAENIIHRIRARNTPAPEPRLTPLEAAIMSAHGYTEETWKRLSNLDRAYFRDTYTKAERYTR